MTRRLPLCALVALCLSCANLGQVRLPRAPAARAAMLRPQFDEHERVALDRGSSVTREVVFGYGGAKYIGAVSAVIVRTTPDLALRDMRRIASIRNWLPFNHRADVVVERDGETVVELVQGVDPFLATFSVIIRPDDGVVHVELDHDRPHDIEDLWAFVAARRYDAEHTLVTYGIAVDVGRGALRLIEKEVQGTFSWIIDDIRDYLEGGDAMFEVHALGRDPRSQEW